jgi:hypothetical protein
VVLREGRHLSLAVEIAVLLGLVGLIGIYIYNPDIAEVWKSGMKQMLPPDLPTDGANRALELIPRFLTGALVAGTVFSLLFGLFLGRWWQANLYNPGGFKQEYLSLSTRPVVAMASIAVVAIAAVSSGLFSDILWNAAILLLSLHVTIGTAALHSLIGKTKMAQFALPAMYISLFVLPYAAVLIAVFGLADAWLDFRKTKSKSI